MDIKDIIYCILAFFTLCGTIFAFSKQFAKIDEIKTGQDKLETGQEKIEKLFYRPDGKLRFQNIDDCRDCRKSCKDEICAYVSKELIRIETNFPRFHDRLDECNENQKLMKKELQAIAIWMDDGNGR